MTGACRVCYYNNTAALSLSADLTIINCYPVTFTVRLHPAPGSVSQGKIVQFAEISIKQEIRVVVNLICEAS